MLSKEENELVTRVGPGTPAGEMLRRYWWPVGFTEHVKEKAARQKCACLAKTSCSSVTAADGSACRTSLFHRGTSLEFGRVEDRGIRCCYHGWLYDVNGRCLEQPAEPADSTFKDRIQHPAYKAQEIAGFIFAYIGRSRVATAALRFVFRREWRARHRRRHGILQLAPTRRELRGSNSSCRAPRA